MSGDSYLGGSITMNSQKLNNASGCGANKPPTSGTASHEMKPERDGGGGKVPLPTRAK